jgi:hypothetical protein
MPKAVLESDQFQFGPYATAFMLADILVGLKDGHIVEFLATPKGQIFKQILISAMGRLRYDQLVADLKAQNNQKDSLVLVVEALVKAAGEDKAGFYQRLTFELLRPLTWNQILDVLQMVTVAVGSAA